MKIIKNDFKNVHKPVQIPQVLLFRLASFRVPKKYLKTTGIMYTFF